MLRSSSLLIISLAASLLLSTKHVVLAQQQCTLCLGGAEANLTKTIGGAPGDPSCSSVASDVETFDEDSCRELNVVGYRWCGCPDFPVDHYCPMCKDAVSDLPNRFKEIPDGTGKTCDDKLFVPKGSVESCEDATKPGYACGCPEAEEPHCKICGGTVEDDSQITKPDALLTIDGVGSYSCQELVNQALLNNLSDEQCGLVKAEAFETCGCPGTAGETMPEESDTPPEESTTDVPVETDEPTSSSRDSLARREFALIALWGAFLMQI